MNQNQDKTTRVIPTVCASHCGGSCLLKVHVKDGIIKRIETDDGPEPQLRGCMRGRAYRQRVYAKDRLRQPLKRVGNRGADRFEPITWDEALDTVADRMRHTKKHYGNKSILYLSMSGDVVSLHNTSTISRLLAMFGGFTTWWGTTSFHGGMFASYFAYGTIFASNTRDDLLNSNMIIMWGWNPAVTVTGTNTAYYLFQAREKGARIIAVDPYYTDSAAAFAGQWIPIKPGTDTAMLVAMAYVIIKEGLLDQQFTDTYTVGFDKFKAYVLGTDDGVSKTPIWAEAITGVSADTIISLAREYASQKPAALMSGTGPGRTAYGEQFHRATITLSAITGNVGIPGGDAAARAWESIVGGYPYQFAGALPYTVNPVEKPVPYPGLWLQKTYPNIHYTKIADAILNGKKGGYPADYKMAIICNANYVNALPNINKIIKAMSALEFVVVEEQFMTATAKYADIILPTTTYMERNDLIKGVGSAFYGIQNRVIEPVGDTRSHNEIAKELAERLHIDDYDPLSEEDRLNKLLNRMKIDDVEAFKRTGIHRLPLTGSHVAFKEQIDDPVNHPFGTPSGKIEIYSQRIADMNNPLIPPIPRYIEPWEGPNDPLRKKYPLQLLTNHWKGRANCQYANMPWVREHTPQALYMNTKDAEARSIRDGDDVRVFNDRGETVTPAAVTERIIPGTVILPFGTWYNPDNNGVDRAGTSNVLTRDEPSPAGAFAYNTALVEVQKL
ncbi:MAG: molybdopterin-dependent oxidoreductase [Desulfobacterales bacterium]